MSSSDSTIGESGCTAGLRRWWLVIPLAMLIACVPVDAMPEGDEAPESSIGSPDLGDAVEVDGRALTAPGDEQVAEPGEDPMLMRIRSLVFYGGGMKVGSRSTRLLLVRGSSVSSEEINYLNDKNDLRWDVVALSSNAVDSLHAEDGEELRFEFGEEGVWTGCEPVSAVFVERVDDKTVVPLPVSLACMRRVDESPHIDRLVENIGGDRKRKVALFIADINGAAHSKPSDDPGNVCFQAEFTMADSGDCALASDPVAVAPDSPFPPRVLSYRTTPPSLDPITRRGSQSSGGSL